MVRKYPGVFLLAFVVAGIIVADQFNFRASIFLLVMVAACVGGWWAISQRKSRLAVLLLSVGIGCFSGFGFGSTYYNAGPNHLSNVLNEPHAFHIYGEVADWPELKPDRTEIEVALDSLRDSSTRKVVGNVLVKVSAPTTALQRGDQVEFYGRIYPVGEDWSSREFDYNRYLKLRSVFGVVYLPTLLDVRVDRRSSLAPGQVIDVMRDWINDCFRRNLEPDHAALASGFLIGETRDISPSVYAMFRDSGTLHLLAVSGSNVALLLLFVTFLIRPFKLSMGKRALILLAVTFLFAELSYEEPSVVRASIMAALVIGARLLGRRYDLNNVIAIAASLILLYSPVQLFDVGFQLSFVTAWGLIFGVPRVSRLFEAYHSRRWYQWLVLPIMISLIAQVVSTPIIVINFERVPVLSVVANLAIVPLVSAGVIGILIMLAAALVWPLLGTFVGSLLNQLLSAVVSVLEIMGGENMLVVNTGHFLSKAWYPWMATASYLFLISLFALINSRLLKKVLLFGCVVAVNLGLVLVVSGSGQQPVRRMEIRTVPGGVAALIYYSSGRSPDMVFTGIKSRDYHIDERIIEPWLESEGANELGSVFVLEADYGGIDDLIRVVRSHGVRNLWVTPALKHSFDDVILADSLPLQAQTGVLHPDERRVFPLVESGYYPGESGLWFVLDQGAVLFANQIKPEHFDQLNSVRDEIRGRTLVLGRRWHPAPDDWIRLHVSGFDAIICPAIEHPSRGSAGVPNGTEGEAFPGYLLDLNRLGPLEIDLTCPHPSSGQ